MLAHAIASDECVRYGGAHVSKMFASEQAAFRAVLRLHIFREQARREWERFVEAFRAYG